MEVLEPLHWAFFNSLVPLPIKGKSGRIHAALLQLWRIFFQWLCPLCSVYTYLMAIIEVGLSFGDFGSFVASAFPTLVLTQVYLRTIHFYRHRKTILRLLKEMLEITLKEAPKEHQLEFKEKIVKRIDFLSKCFIAMFTLETVTAMPMCVSVIIASLRGKFPQMPTHTWAPVDIKKQPNNIIIALINSLTIFHAGSMGPAHVTIMHTLISLLTIQAENLGKGIKQTDKYEIELGKWIKLHQKHRRIFEEMKTWFSLIIFVNYVQFFTLLLITCIQVVGTTYQFIQIVTVFMVVTWNLLIFYSLCHASDKFVDTNNFIDAEFFNHRAILRTKKTPQAILVIKTVGNRRRQLSAYSNYALSRMNFSQLFKATFSYIMTIIQIKQRRHQDSLL